MRAFLFFLLIVSEATSVAPIAAPPQPAAVSQPVHKLKQVTRRELVARAKYPEHFFDKRQEPSPEPGTPCQGFSTRRRDLESTYDQVLGPSEAVAFFKGKGQFVSENGTVYTDHHFANAVASGRERASRWPAVNRAYKKVKNMAGQTLLAISIPHYKRWKRTLVPGDVVWLSPKTYIRHEDVDEIERLLLVDPEFVDIELSGIHITRSFLEAALAY